MTLAIATAGVAQGTYESPFGRSGFRLSHGSRIDGSLQAPNEHEP